MNRQRSPLPTVVCVVLRRPDGCYLLVQPTEPPNAPWMVPKRQLTVHADPAEVLRQACLADLGVDLPTALPLDVFHHAVGPQTVLVRPFLVCLHQDQVQPLAVRSIRWMMPHDPPPSNCEPLTRHLLVALVHDRPSAG